MKKIVVDTNVIVSAVITPNGISAKIIDLITDNEEIELYYNPAILAEYMDVLSREKFKISSTTQSETLNAVKDMGIIVEPTASDMPMPDETDRVFYDTAQASGAILITGNTKHYPVEPFIMKPAGFWEKWQQLFGSNGNGLGRGLLC